MNKRQLLFAFFLGTALVWTSCGNKDANKQGAAQAPAEKVVPVTFGVASHEIVTGTVSYPATVKPLNEADLFAEVSGYITKIYVSDGAVVSKGQALYEIDGTRYSAAVQQAKASLQVAQTELDRQKRDLARYQALADKDAIAKQVYDNAVSNVAASQAQVESARAALVTANTNLSRSTIRAPFAGTVGISQVRLGALVNPGTTLLNTLSSTSPIAVEFQVNEKDINKFVQMQNSRSSSDLSLLLPDGSNYEGKGSITTIDRAVDPATGTIKVRATFPNNANVLRAGMNITMNVSSTSATEEVVVPYKAIFEQLGVFNLYTVNDSSKAEIRQVKLGIKAGDKIVIKEGVKDGEKIIVDGAMNVQNGVKVVDAAVAAQQAAKGAPQGK
ncbi:MULTISPECIES: efflux RND transporter periplasmic adaptor subunit [Sphingobacterium]|uniref:efflux RND transporter periplasmic adaptor subunit n=1 Tax=Sphingobacterium TaxID=28453 RepID=UPI002244C9A0|nr:MULTISPECIES: efflux RND transporter periplasmic adaptor subunit [Sphingobacterium]MCW8313324.1 efflux RND transporter periplasmic adaptor subunit [Sphingobacterium sp. InxBP1]